MSELISGNNEAFVIPTVLLRRFSKLISAQPASIDTFKIKVPCMRLSSCSFVEKYLCGGNAVEMITTADPVDVIDVAIIAERLEIPALFYLALHVIHENMVTMVRYPNRAMLVHVFTHCMSDSPLKDFMLSLLYRHLFVLGRSELEWRHVDGKGVPITSEDLLPGMWLTELRLKIGGHLRLPKIEPDNPGHWGQPDCKAESMLIRKNLKHFIEGIEKAQDNDLIDDAAIVPYYLNALLQDPATRCMYSCFSSLLHWDRICSLPMKRPVVLHCPPPTVEAATTASTPAPAPAATVNKIATFTPVSIKLKRKADEAPATAPASKRLAMDDGPKKKAICPRKGVGRQFKTVNVVCRDRATLLVNHAPLYAASKAAARLLQHNPGQNVVEFPDMDIADFERLKHCIDKPGVLPTMNSWSLRQKLSTIVSAEAIEAFAIANLLRRAVEQLFRDQLMCFAVAKFVHKRSSTESKLRVFVMDCMHWVLMKNGRVEKLKEECERNKATALYSDLVAAGKKHGSGEHPCKEMRWKLDEPCVCAETITVVKVGRRRDHVCKECDCHLGSLE